MVIWSSNKSATVRIDYNYGYCYCYDYGCNYGYDYGYLPTLQSIFLESKDFETCLKKPFK